MPGRGTNGRDRPLRQHVPLPGRWFEKASDPDEEVLEIDDIVARHLQLLAAQSILVQSTPLEPTWCNGKQQWNWLLVMFVDMGDSLNIELWITMGA